MSNNHYWIFDNIEFYVPRQKIYESNQEQVKFRNENMPVPAADTALFLDGTSLQIARPSGPQLYQRNTFKSPIVAPDGVVVDFFGPLTGRRHDSYVLEKV